MKKNGAAIAAVLAIVVLTGGSILWYSKIYAPARQAEQIAALQAQEIPVQAEAGTDYDYHIPVSAEAVQEAVAAANSKPSAESSVEVRTDENGDVWITRDWSNGEGLKETTPPSENDSGAEANIAAGTATEIPFDENGAYSEQHPEAASAPEQPKQDEQPAPTPAPEQKPAASSSGSAPKNGSTKVENGQEYIWNSVWNQWIPVGGGNVQTQGSNAGEGYYGIPEEAASF